MFAASEGSDFSRLPRAVRLQLAIAQPAVFGALGGFLLATDATAYWILTVVAVLGGLAGGFDHSTGRGAAGRGLLSGSAFGAGLISAYAFHGGVALVEIPSPAGLLVPIAAGSGVVLGIAGSALRRKGTRWSAEAKSGSDRIRP